MEYTFPDSGQFLTQKIQQDESRLELAFVWNRSIEILRKKGIDSEYIIENLEDCRSKSPDLIVEVAHPVVVEKVYKYSILIVESIMK